VVEMWDDGSWHRSDLNTTPGFVRAAVGPLSGYTWDVDTTEHVIFVGNGDGHVYELWFDGSWHCHDLHAIAT